MENLEKKHEFREFFFACSLINCMNSNHHPEWKKKQLSLLRENYIGEELPGREMAFDAEL